MKNRQRDITPVIELCSSKNLSSIPWSFSDSSQSFLHLSGECTSDEVGLFAAVLVTYNDLELGAESSSTIENINSAKSLIAPGGLAFSDETHTVYPGCCCGLETWREWVSFADGGPDPWGGHDPFVHAEKLDGSVRIWSDFASEHSVDPYFVEMTHEEFNLALRKAEANFLFFLDRVREWCISEDIQNEAEFLSKLNKEFEITSQ